MASDECSFSMYLEEYVSKFKVRGVVVTRHEATSVSILCSDDIFQLLHIFDDSGEVGSEGGFRWFDAEAGTFYISQYRGWLCWFHPGSVAVTSNLKECCTLVVESDKQTNDTG